MKIEKKTWKAISLKQPQANWVANGKKTIETRKWATKYGGDLVICSSQNPKIEPYGKAICIVELYDIKPMQKEHEEKACIKVYPKAQAWFLKNIRPINPPIPVKGQLNIFKLDLNLSLKQIS